MAIEGHSGRIAQRRVLLDQLLRQKGFTRFGLFAVTTEGKSLPDGSESASGLVVDAEGNVFSFWLDWDESQRRIALTDLDPVQPGADWASDEEYQAARRTAGLG
jgi:hypothetical protein